MKLLLAPGLEPHFGTCPTTGKRVMAVPEYSLKGWPEVPPSKAFLSLSKGETKEVQNSFVSRMATRVMFG